MLFTIKEHRQFNGKGFNNFILSGDVGGTNTTLGLFGIENKLPNLILSFHVESRKIKDFGYAVNEALEFIRTKYKIRIMHACIAVAGVLSTDRKRAKITNGRWNVDRDILLKKTKLKKINLINDLEAVGYGISLLRQKDFATIKKGEKLLKAPIAAIGAGTGLGKATLIYCNQSKSYIPFPSEAGHSDFPAQSQQELELVNFIKKHKKTNQSVSYEQVLSGQGLVNIYSFFRKNERFKETKYTEEIDNSNNNPELISKYRKIDDACKATFKIFVKNYAAFARNAALESLAYGGVYVSGGIAQRNKDIFNKSFVKEFQNNYRMHRILKRIPVLLVVNSNTGLFGAALAGLRHL